MEPKYSFRQVGDSAGGLGGGWREGAGVDGEVVNFEEHRRFDSDRLGVVSGST